MMTNIQSKSIKINSIKLKCMIITFSWNWILSLSKQNIEISHKTKITDKDARHLESEHVYKVSCQQMKPSECLNIAML